MIKPLDAKKNDIVHGGASFPLGNRIFRLIWIITWAVLASWTPAPLHAWRRLVLRAFGAKIASTARIYGSARIWYPPNLEMGEYSSMGWEVDCYCQDKVTIDAYATISQFAHLVTGTHYIDEPYFQLYIRPIHIDRHAWVASGAFVGPGVTVGEGAVLGARGVAFKSLEPWTVYGGNPAREIRKRRNWSGDSPT